MFVGSGTLANDAIAATLAAGPNADRGLMLVSGEFGGRIARQAKRAGLNPRLLTWDWGQPWDLQRIDEALAGLSGGWVWGRAPRDEHRRAERPGRAGGGGRPARRAGLPGLRQQLGHGADRLDRRLPGVRRVGKALGSYAGLSFVFANPADLTGLDADRLPTYLDVPATLATDGPRFTVVSPLVCHHQQPLRPGDAGGLVVEEGELAARPLDPVETVCCQRWLCGRILHGESWGLGGRLWGGLLAL